MNFLLLLAFIWLCVFVQITDGRYFVLSDDCCRTQKFLMGLALGIPVVSYTWITDCIQQVSLASQGAWHRERRIRVSEIYWIQVERQR